MAECPGWLMDFYLTGKYPTLSETGGFFAEKYMRVTPTYVPRYPEKHEELLWERHRALVLAEAARRGVAEPYGLRFEAA